MLRRDVQGLEIVPGVFHLRPLGHAEPQPAHDLFQLFDRLRDRMQAAQTGADSGHRGIELPGLGLGTHAVGQPRTGGLVSGLDRLLDLVEPFAGGRFLGLIDRAQALLHGLQPPALDAEELDACGL